MKWLPYYDEEFCDYVLPPWVLLIFPIGVPLVYPLGFLLMRWLAWT